MKGYGQDTESESGARRERTTERPGAVTDAIHKLDEVYPQYDKVIKKYFKRFPKTKVNSIIREGWQVTYLARTRDWSGEIEWCRIQLGIGWPSASRDGYGTMYLNWNEELEMIDPERYKLGNTEDFKQFFFAYSGITALSGNK